MTVAAAAGGAGAASVGGGSGQKAHGIQPRPHLLHRILNAGGNRLKYKQWVKQAC